jgi:hypothetical protein
MTCYVEIKPTTVFDLTSAVCCQFRDITTCCKISQQLPMHDHIPDCLMQISEKLPAA